MLWDAQELKMDGGTFDAYTGLYNVPSNPKTWDQQCPSLVTADPLLEPDEYENALVKRVKDVCNVQSCEISFHLLCPIVVVACELAGGATWILCCP